MLGSNSKLTQNSFFKHMYDVVSNILKREYVFDSILIDVFKITDEKFVLDHVIKEII